MEQNFLTTYTADQFDPFWACAVKGCQVPFPHEVGMTEDRRWKHVWADFYYPTPEKFIVGVQLDRIAVKAFDVCIKKTNVYVNYSMPAMGEAHCSYHASGQQHTKKHGNYEWKRMPNGRWERIIEFKMEPGKVITRSACQDPVAWEVGKLASALYPLNEAADMMVDARGFAESSLLLFKIYVVGAWAREHKIRPGFRKVMRRRFGTGLRIEIEAFEASPSAPSVVSIETF